MIFFETIRHSEVELNEILTRPITFLYNNKYNKYLTLVKYLKAYIIISYTYLFFKSLNVYIPNIYYNNIQN